ncbi:MAG: TRAP transporter large permease subunit [Alphaproteobacteria bacterium]|nr:TRAP transporter large permease subunit [Alphaproteobacteria bacterium]
MGSETLAALMFPLLFLFVFLGVPVAFALIATAFLMALPAFGELASLQIYNQIQNTASQLLLTAVPAFVFMGVMLEASGISERLFRAMQVWMGRLPGGLSLATMTMAAIIAASTGIVGAVEVVIGVMAIPIMMRNGYNKSLISGTICAGGSLGTMIPPSIVVVIYAAISQQSVGKLFAAVLFPALIMVALFLGYILLRAILKPEDAPRAVEEEPVPLLEKLKITATGMLPAAALIVAVLGAILLGVATPTEAASVGALGAVILTVLYGRFSWAVLYDTLERTLKINCMILLIVAGGNMFAGIFRLHRGNALVQDIVTSLDLTAFGIVGALLLIVFIAGFILDWVSVVLITLPIFLPILAQFEIDEIWFATVMIVVIQTSYLTPPMAPSIFYLRSIAPASITFGDMYRGVMPFIICQIIVLALVMMFPELATYLPSQLQSYE